MDNEETEHTPGEPRRVGEVRAAYHAEPTAEPPEYGLTKLSGKHQLTLPAAMVRDLDWRPGDGIELMRVGDRITLTRQPRTPEEWVARFRGSIDVPEWRTKEDIDAWVRRERDSWERDWDHDS